MPPGTLDPSFQALPYAQLADAALARAKDLGATYADFRFERHRGQVIVARDRELQTLVTTDSLGYSVRVIAGGSWGFASAIDLSSDGAAAAAARAVEVARALAVLNSEPVELAVAPAHTVT